MILKNVTEGPKVLNTLAGPVTVPAGGEAEVELSEGEHLSALSTEWFEEVELDAPAKPAKGKAEAEPAKE